MAGPALLEGVLNFQPRRITKVGERSNPVFRSFIASFDVAFYNVPFHSGVAHLLFLSKRLDGSSVLIIFASALSTKDRHRIRKTLSQYHANPAH